MKRWLLALMLSSFVMASYAAELVSTATANNGNAGIMFDVRALNATTINGLSMLQDLASGVNNVSIYTKSGSHVGFENSPGAWTLLGTVPVTADGTRKQIPLRFDVSVPAGNLQAFLYLPETPYDIKLTELLVTFTAPMRISKSCPEPARQGSTREAILAEPSLAASFTTWLRSLLLQLFQAPRRAPLFQQHSVRRSQFVLRTPVIFLSQEFQCPSLPRWR